MKLACVAARAEAERVTGNHGLKCLKCLGRRAGTIVLCLKLTLCALLFAFATGYLAPHSSSAFSSRLTTSTSSHGTRCEPSNVPGA